MEPLSDDKIANRADVTHSEGGKGSATKRRRGSGNVLTVISQYRHEPGMSHTERMAHFLQWAAKALPRVPIPANLVLKAIMGYAKTPRIGSEEVDLLRGRTSAARKVLKGKYGKGLEVERGLGMRATTNDEDLADTQYRKDMQRVVSAVAGANETHALIDATKIKNDRLRAWVKNAGSQVKQLGLGDRLLKLCAPKPEDDDGNEGEKK